MTTPNTRRRFVRLLAPLAVLGLVTAACGSDDDSSSSDTEPASTDAPAATDAPAETTEPATTEMMDEPTIVVRGQDFSESITIAEVYGQYLQAQGFDVEILTPAGFRAEAAKAPGSVPA